MPLRFKVLTIVVSFTIWIVGLGLPAVAQNVNSDTKPSKPPTINRPATNQSWDSVRDYWKHQAERDTKPTYPKLTFGKQTTVGDVGLGDQNQSLTILEQRGENEFLVSVWKPVRQDVEVASTDNPLFLFRRFDFSRIPVGGTLPTPGLCQISGTYDFIDSALGSKRSVLVVEPLAKSSLPLPSFRGQAANKKSRANQLRPNAS